MKLSIYHGKAKPLVAIGKNQVRLLQFAFDYPSWHYFNEDCRTTQKAIDGLLKRGSILLNEFNQFKVNL
jgi:hypothetical protein